jgi:hypothetical protein
VAADILTVCDALVDAVEAALTNPSDATVERLYLAPLDMASDTSRHVWLFPAVFGSNPENRGEDSLTYRVGVVVAERYTAAGEPTVAWTDARVTFAQEHVFDALDFSRAPLAFATTRRLLTTNGELAIYDPDRLQRGLFWAEMTLEFREIKLI